MHRYYAAYLVFYLTFMPAIVGKCRFKNRLKNLPGGKEIATISDEALTLLGLENGVTRSDDVYTKSVGKQEILNTSNLKKKLNTYSYNATMSPSDEGLALGRCPTTSRGLPTPSPSAGSPAVRVRRLKGFMCAPVIP